MVTCALVLPAMLHAQSSLETPGPGSFVTGIGYVRGWKCIAGILTFTIDNGPAASLSYGSSRGDTASVCNDDGNNGFITQLNWNLLPTGQHTIRVFDDGVQFAQAPFTSTSLGSQFLTGQTGQTTLSFAGKQVTLTWQQDQQNFVITSATGGGGFTDLSSLIGGWLFSYTIINTFTDTYTLTTLITSSSGVPGLLGKNALGGPVIATRIHDVDPSSPVPYTFALLDPSIIICNFFAFDLTTINSVSGIYAAFFTDSAGNCTSNIVGNNTYAMSGVRLSAAMVAQSQAAQQTLEQQAIAEAGQMQAETIGEPDTSSALADMMLQLQELGRR